MKKVVINGKFLSKTNPRGVQRYSREIVNALDKFVIPGEVILLVPQCVKCVPRYDNIEVKKYGGKFSAKMWQALAYQIYVLSHGALAVSLSDGIPYICPGICAIHDIGYSIPTKKFSSKKAFMANTIDRFNGWWVTRFSKKIITVSNFSKRNICDYYKISDSRVVVAYNSWEHIKNRKFDDSIFEQYSNIIRKGKYYFTLGGKGKTKNLRWIYNMAQKYTDSIFVLAGPAVGVSDCDSIDWEKAKNIVHVGFVSDEQIRSLMANCKAFLFPSLYEGFGIPPMEAISVGAKVICSNAACLPEIYKDSVIYFDPTNYDLDLNELVNIEIKNPKTILQDYSWEKSARVIWNVICEERNNV